MKKVDMNRSNFKSLTNVTDLDRKDSAKFGQNEATKFELTDEEIKERVKLLSNQALCSSKRMLNYCQQSEIFGYNAAKLLTDQNEKLNNIEKDMNRMGLGLNEVERNLDELKNSNCCLDLKTLFEILMFFFCCCCCRKKKRNNKTKEKLSDVIISQGRLSQTDSSESDNESELRSSSDESIKSKKFSLKRMLSAKSLSSLKNENLKSFINRIRLRKVDSNISIASKYKKNKSIKSLNQSDSEEDYVESINDAKEKLNENLKNIFNKLDDLQTMASDIGSMINKQNEKITDMDKRTDMTVNKVKSADKVGKLICKTKSNKSIRTLMPSKSLKSILTLKK